MTKVILYIAISEDGFIADNEGGVDWLPHPSEEYEDMGYQSLLDRISSIVMGSRSYQQILGFGDWAWADKQTYVFTRQPLETTNDNIHFVREDVGTFTRILANNESEKDVWLLGGAELTKSFASQQMIDECIITIIPVKLGTGIKLDIPYEDFRLDSTKHFQDGIRQLHYLKKIGSHS
jgi:dihydrofolate reductase